MSACIVVPSYNRYVLRLAKTLTVLAKMKPPYPIFLVVRCCQKPQYEYLVAQLGLKLTLVSTKYTGACAARNAGLEAAVKSGFDKMIIMDDDLNFAARSNGHLLTIKDRIVFANMLRMQVGLLNEYAHVAISIRLGNNYVKQDVKTVTRGHTCVGYSLEVLQINNLRFELNGREGMHLTLRLLELGYPNAVIYKYAVNSCGKNVHDKTGSELLWSEQTAKKLAEAHPGIVTLLERDFKMGKRVEVRINWKRALKLPVRS